ncbi:MAG: 4-phosphoerythronate dehydrogenase [Legionella longbeachae]|nr:4-phosphoerythronate dehydrogenase [Legionella longbeachae]
MNILADASLPGLEQAFPKPFHLTLYHHPEEIASLLPKQEVLFCRSTLKVNHSLLKNHCLRYVATASSGTDHLNHSWLHSQNIQIIDAKGSNAGAVADYVIACLAFLNQQNLVHGKKAGIIGLGKVGVQVATRLQAAHFHTFNYDPLKELQTANSFQSCILEDLYQVDLLCIHAELHQAPLYPSAHLINKTFLAQLKPGCIIINAARGGIVNEEDLLSSHNALTYCTDVYLNEPTIDQRIIDKAILCTPHVAGHSLEAKFAAVSMISEKLHQLADLPTPQFTKPQLPNKILLNYEAPWYKSILEIYNPHLETLELKKALDIKAAFLSLRKAHQKRHDFSLYFKDPILNDQTRLLLGM